MKHRPPLRRFMTFDHAFSGTRVSEAHLTPSNWQLSVDIVWVKGDDDFDATYNRIQYWLLFVLDDILAVNTLDQVDMGIADTVSNTQFHCPGYPTDNILVQLLHAKLRAMAGQSMLIGEVALKSDTTGIRYTYDCHQGDHEVPSDNGYMGRTTYYESPWWFRNDGFCYKDFGNGEEEDPLNDFYESLQSACSAREPTRSADIIKLSDWRPTKV